MKKIENLRIRDYGTNGFYISNEDYNCLNKDGTIHNTTRINIVSTDIDGTYRTRGLAQEHLDKYYSKTYKVMLGSTNSPIGSYNNLEDARKEAVYLAGKSGNIGRRVNIIEVIESYVAEAVVIKV